MTITSIDAQAAAAAAPGRGADMISARSDVGDIAVRFAPGDGVSSALDRVGSGVLSKLKQYEAGRAARAEAVFNVTSGPANPVDSAKSELTSGPASAMGAEGPSPARIGGECAGRRCAVGDDPQLRLRDRNAVDRQDRVTALDVRVLDDARRVIVTTYRFPAREGLADRSRGRRRFDRNAGSRCMMAFRNAMPIR